MQGLKYWNCPLINTNLTISVLSNVIYESTAYLKVKRLFSNSVLLLMCTVILFLSDMYNCSTCSYSVRAAVVFDYCRCFGSLRLLCGRAQQIKKGTKKKRTTNSPRPRGQTIKGFQTQSLGGRLQT